MLERPLVLLHQFVERDVGVSGDVPPAPEVGLPEPVFEGQPTERLQDELALPEVCGLVHPGDVAGQGADLAQGLQGRVGIKLVTSTLSYVHGTLSSLFTMRISR